MDIHTDDKTWTDITVDGVTGRYAVSDGTITVEYKHHSKTREGAFASPLANAAAEGLARLLLGEMIAEYGV